MSKQKVAVAGATGRLGRHIVDVLIERGHEVVRMSRATGVDIVAGGAPLADALTDVDVIVDAASWPVSEERAATEFFRVSARNLHEAGRRAGVARIAVASIIGVDRTTGGFGAAKKVHEQVHMAEGLPVRVLRAAQFHEFVGQLLDWQRGDVAYIPNWPSQLVAARTAAQALVDLALDSDGPAGAVPGAPFPEIAGPRREILSDAAALLGARRGVKVVGVDNPGLPGTDDIAEDALLPGPHARLAGPTFQEWLDGGDASA
ncbi:NAD(P)H-binding protein [Streptomyces sp. NPDC048518]|uniref:SDR family oxidoreductase n=1 Tax=Streptomyces sp. NPDC048518 TaxID=3155029 RepID=UPI0034102FDA